MSAHARNQGILTDKQRGDCVQGSSFSLNRLVRQNAMLKENLDESFRPIVPLIIIL